MSSGLVYAFGPFRLDTRSNELTRGGERIAISDRHISVLQHLRGQCRSIASKEALITAAWEDVAVTDNSLEQVISALRRLLGDGPGGRPYLETVPRRGYRFAGEVSRLVRRESDQALDALLAPHRAWIEDARLSKHSSAIKSFPHEKRSRPRCAVRPTSRPPMSAWQTPACCSSRRRGPTNRVIPPRWQRRRIMPAKACRLDAGYAEAWATLGFVLERTGSRVDALRRRGAR